MLSYSSKGEARCSLATTPFPLYRKKNTINQFTCYYNKLSCLYTQRYKCILYILTYVQSPTSVQRLYNRVADLLPYNLLIIPKDSSLTGFGEGSEGISLSLKE
jgi:hypothetical protein